MSDVINIPLNKIEVGKRVRPAYPAKVEALILSIQNCDAGGIGWDGLRLPIEVFAKGDGYVLVSGLTRLRALERLDREFGPAIVLGVETISARQLELEENLDRSELTKLDRAIFVSEFRDLFEAENGEVKRGGAQEFSPSSWQTPNMGVWSKVAPARLAMSIQAIERCLNIAKGLRPEVVDMLRGLDWADNQKALLELAAVPAEQQRNVVTILLDEESCADTMREAIAMAAGAEPPAQSDKDEQWFRKSITIFTAHKRLRRRFFAEALKSDFDVLREAAEENGFTVEAIKGWRG